VDSKIEEIHWKSVQKSGSLEFICHACFARFACLARLASGIEPTPAARSHPSTRARGQDDVSYTNSLKLNSRSMIFVFNAIFNIIW